MATYTLDIDDRGRAHKDYDCVSVEVTDDGNGGYIIEDTEDAMNGDTAYEMDTGTVYMYSEKKGTWLKQDFTA